MHFHIPKPLHGWRELAGEVGIIVLGVLIALGAEQGVEAVHDRHVAGETRDTLREEIDDNLASLQLRESVEPCIQRRLGEVRAIVDEWGRTGTYSTPGWVGFAPHWGIVTPRYDAAVSAGRLSILPREEQYRLGAVVQGLRSFADVQAQEAPEWARLAILRSGAAALSPTDRTAVREALQQAWYLDYSARLYQRQILGLARQYGFQVSERRIRERLRNVKKNGSRPSICLPIEDTSDAVSRLSGQVVPLPQ